MIEKQMFKFYLPDGSVETNFDPAYLTGLGMLTDYINRVEALQVSHYKNISWYEKEWRDRQVQGTDWMMLSDATYESARLQGSSKLDDIIVYREALRNYNYTSSDPRPIKPVWFDGVRD